MSQVAQKKTRKFRLMVGTHVEPHKRHGKEGHADVRRPPKVYHAGVQGEDIVEVGEERDLTKEFLNKFQEIKEAPPAPAPVPAPVVVVAPVPAPEPTKEEEPVGETASLLVPGEDVTDEFPKAKESALKVFKKDDKYLVTELETPDVTLNKDDLTGKRKVNEFVDKYLKG